MTDEQHNELLDAVDLLTKDRIIHTTITDDDTGAWVGVHTETHPPLLIMLLEGTGISSGGRSSDPGIPIDADALELWAQVRDLTRLWCRQLDASFMPDDLLVSIRHWYLAHTNARNSKKVSDATHLDVTRMVQGWVRMIEGKFNPPEIRHWTEPCPASIPTLDINGDHIGYRICKARRIVVNGEERFAVILNVTTMVAECGRCHAKWVGDLGVLDLRKATELQKLICAEEEEERMAELARLAAGDTPEEYFDQMLA